MNPTFMRRAVDAANEQQAVVGAMLQLFREGVEVLPVLSAEDGARAVGVVGPMDVARKAIRLKRESMLPPWASSGEGGLTMRKLWISLVQRPMRTVSTEPSTHANVVMPPATGSTCRDSWLQTWTLPSLAPLG